MIKPGRASAKLVSKKELSSKVTQVTFEIIEPRNFVFEPGQFVTLLVSDKIARVYSICTAPKDLPFFSMAIETAHEGVGSHYIRSLKIGDIIRFIGPSGRVTLPETLPEHLYFFATGTGIAPFISLFYALTERNYEGDIDLYYGIRRESEIIFKKELETFRENLPRFNFKMCYSKPEEPINATERITSMLPNMNDSSALYFLCGHPLMAGDMFVGLLGNGINEKNIIKEEFVRMETALFK